MVTGDLAIVFWAYRLRQFLDGYAQFDGTVIVFEGEQCLADHNVVPNGGGFRRLNPTRVNALRDNGRVQDQHLPEWPARESDPSTSPGWKLAFRHVRPARQGRGRNHANTREELQGDERAAVWPGVVRPEPSASRPNANRRARFSAPKVFSDPRSESAGFDYPAPATRTLLMACEANRTINRERLSVCDTQQRPEREQQWFSSAISVVLSAELQGGRAGRKRTTNATPEPEDL